MSLKFSDALRLSWSNIAQHKKRSLNIVLTISLLFGIIMGFNILAFGIEKTTISASADQTNGSVYVEARYRENLFDDSPDFYFKSINTPEELSKISLEPVLDSSADQKIRDRAQQYGGTVVGYYWYYQLDYPYKVISASAVTDFIEKDLDSVPKDQIPTLMPENWTPPAMMRSLKDRLGNTLYRIGTIPSTEAGRPTLPGLNPLNLILTQLTSNTNYDFWLIDDGSGKIIPFIESQLKSFFTGENAWYSTKPVQKTAIVKFDDPYKAVAFADPGEEYLGVKLYTQNFHYSAQDLFGTTLMINNSFNTQRVLLIAIEILLLIIATIIAVFTFAHLIDQDAATVALYRSLGASTGHIYLIYFLYLLELCLLAIVASILIALIFVALVSLTSASALASRLQAFYHLNALPKVTLLTFTPTFWLILGLILLIAPLSLLFTLRHFSARNIAKKLKED